MEELRERFPEELVWNVMKYMSHPCADILRSRMKDFEAFRGDGNDFYTFPKYMLKDEVETIDYYCCCASCGEVTPEWVLEASSGYMCDDCQREEDEHWERERRHR